jgi:Tol biopolymer transport system component
MAVTVYPKEFPGTSRHVTFTVGEEDKEPHRLAPGMLDWDGHCTWSPDGKWMSSEGYFDKSRLRNWVLMRREDEATIPVGSFAVPKEYESDWRCDLHARWRPDGKQLGFNSVHEGTRQIYVIDLEGR